MRKGDRRRNHLPRTPEASADPHRGRPSVVLPDVSLLSSLSDAVLLVVESGRVRYDLVQRTVESVGADRIFGVVLNKVPESDIVAAYGMHYYAPYR